MKKCGLVFAFVAVLFAGWFGGRSTVSPKSAGVSREASWQTKHEKGTESPLLFEPYYFKAKESIEVKFEQQVTFIDGELFRGENLDAAILKKKDQAKARFLVFVGEDHEPFGPVVERLSLAWLRDCCPHVHERPEMKPEPNQSLQPTASSRRG